MRGREPRCAVCIPARMFADATWIDVTIRNVSSRGMLLETSAPLKRGTYLEVRRGSAVIIARAVWTSGQALGAQTQDIILLDRLIKGSREIDPGLILSRSGVTMERRWVVRPAQRLEHNRLLSRAFQFITVCAFAVLTCGSMASLVYEALGEPASALSVALR